MGQSAGVARTLPREPFGPRGNVLVLGYEGGVGHALLSVLADSEVGHELLGGIERLVLIDERPSQEPSVSTQVQVLAPHRIETRDELTAVLVAHAIDQLLDLSDLPVLDCVAACTTAGVSCVSMRTNVDPNQLANHSVAHSISNRSYGGTARVSHLLQRAANTPLGAAACVTAGWMQLGRVAGVHTIEQLEAQAYRQCVESLLTPEALCAAHAFVRASADHLRPAP